MPKATKEQDELFQTITDQATYKLHVSNPANQLKVIEMDEVPELDSSGRRKCEGFKMVWEATVDPEWTNLVGGLHGAASAWIVDTCTSATIVPLTTETFWGPPMLAGVSLNINTDYYNPAFAGTRIRVVCEITRLSASLANISCEISDFDNGKLFCRGTHLKMWKPAPRAKL